MPKRNYTHTHMVRDNVRIIFIVGKFLPTWHIKMETGGSLLAQPFVNCNIYNQLLWYSLFIRILEEFENQEKSNVYLL